MTIKSKKMTHHSFHSHQGDHVFFAGYQTAIALLLHCLFSSLEILTSVWTRRIWSRYKNFPKSPCSAAVVFHTPLTFDLPPAALVYVGAGADRKEGQQRRGGENHLGGKRQRPPGEQSRRGEGAGRLWTRVVLTLLYLQVLLHIEDKLFAYLHQAFFREDNGKGVSRHQFVMVPVKWQSFPPRPGTNFGFPFYSF